MERLLCDFHIHTRMSDGSLSLKEVVDLYGRYGFDVIAITDHVLDGESIRRLREKGREVRSVREENFREYVNALRRERERAWKEYRMLLIPGFELTNNTEYYHIVVLDVEEFIDPSLSVEEIIKAVRDRGGLTIAAHPEKKNSDGEHLSKHLLENMDAYIDLFDAWEIANQFDLFNSVRLKRCRFVANSDFHQPKHFHSWKTLIRAEKDVEAVKEAIRKNEEVVAFFMKPGLKPEEVKEIFYLCVV